MFQIYNPQRDKKIPRPVRNGPGTGQKGAVRGRIQPLQARGPGQGRQRRCRAGKGQRAHDRSDRHRQDTAGQNPGQEAQGSVRHRRRYDSDRSGVRGRRRGEYPSQADPERGQQHSRRGEGHYLHR